MKDKILDLIAKGETQQALEQLLPYNSGVVLLQSRWAMLIQERLDGLVTRENYLAERTIITNSLIKLLDATNFNNAPIYTEPATSAPKKPDSPIITGKKNVFVAYDSQDEDLQKRLHSHLAPLRRSNKISVWNNEEILGGDAIGEKIIERLHEANIILLLVSPSFIGSDEIWERELKIAMQRHNDGAAAVVPVILKPCDWKNMPFGKLQALPRGEKAVVENKDIDKALLEVAKGISKLADATQ